MGDISVADGAAFGALIAAKSNLFRASSPAILHGALHFADIFGSPQPRFSNKRGTLRVRESGGILLKIWENRG